MKDSRVFIIQGKQGEGKTGKLKALVHLLQPSLPGVFGFYAPGEWENGLRKAFRIIDIASGRQHLLCTRKGRTGISKGTFVFNPATLQEGEHILRNGIQQHGALAVVDEIGRYELQGKVWHDILIVLLENKIPVLMTVRENLVEKIISHFQITHPVIFPVEEPAESMARTILDEII